MTEEMNVTQNPIELTDSEEKKSSDQTKFQNLILSLKSVQDDIGQISELSSEEKTLVAEFFEALLKLMQPLAATIPVSITALPAELGDVVQANIDPTGHLMVLHRTGQAELKDLREEKNRDLMVAIVEDVMPKFKKLTEAQKKKIEKRMNLLSAVTAELQKISKAISTALT